MCDFFTNINWNLISAIFGVIGTFIIFFFGLPSRINESGHINLILEQADEKEKRKAKWFMKISYLGIMFLILSYSIQVILTIK